MACSCVIRLGDEKTSIELVVIDCKPDGTEEIVDITNATELLIRFKRNDKTEIETELLIHDCFNRLLVKNPALFQSFKHKFDTFR